MKKLILLSLLCLAANTSLLGQIGKGSVTVRGGAELDYLFAEEETRTGFSYDFFPRFGLMVTDHWMVGGSISIRGFDDSVYPSEVIPEVRYYINSASTKNSYYAGLRCILGINYPALSSYGFRLGFNRFLNEHIAFNVRAIYSVRPRMPNGILLFFGLQPFMNRADRARWRSAVSAFSKGDFIINSGLGGVSVRNNIIQMRLRPNLGLFLSEHTLVGVELSAYHLQNLNREVQYKSNGLSIAPYLRHYFSNEQKHWRWYGQTGFLFSSLRFESSSSERDTLISLLNSRLGVNWFLTPNLAFDMGLGLDYHIWTNVNGANPWNGSFDGPLPNSGLRVGASIGVQYFLQRGN
ncbi:hypothetical protein [Phaeodactylibacter xiamenensis]|uniref:hypothetical protein n=1 Tax=Phaeodactylibacter xiamenensis TaxID=1524460 RepID=UPI003BAC2EC4